MGAKLERRFTIGDAMILVAAAASGLALLRLLNVGDTLAWRPASRGR